MDENLETELKHILQESFGHAQFRLNQLDIIKNILQGDDTLGILPTGGGKSVCYQIPALYLEGITIVISPLISLMQDQVTNLAQNGIRACFINSTLTPEERADIENDIISGEVKIVYLSPEGLLAGGLTHFFSQLEISLIAIDEAHCVSQWGHEFRQDYTRLGVLKERFPATPILALTATADSKTRDDIIFQLKQNNPKVFISSFDRPNINYTICEKENELQQLNSFIKEKHSKHTGIIYCLSRKKVEKISQDLNELGYKTRPYHAGLPQEVRTKTQQAFNTEDGIIIVATIAFGMGIDRPDVRLSLIHI